MAYRSGNSFLSARDTSHQQAVVWWHWRSLDMRQEAVFAGPPLPGRSGAHIYAQLGNDCICRSDARRQGQSILSAALCRCAAPCRLRTP